MQNFSVLQGTSMLNWFSCIGHLFPKLQCWSKVFTSHFLWVRLEAACWCCSVPGLRSYSKMLSGQCSLQRLIWGLKDSFPRCNSAWIFRSYRVGTLRSSWRTPGIVYCAHDTVCPSYAPYKAEVTVIFVTEKVIVILSSFILIYRRLQRLP